MRYLTLPLLFVSFFFIGCGGGDSISSKVAQYNKENVQKAANMYSIYTKLHKFTGPASIEEFREFMTTSEDAKRRAQFLNLDLNKFDSYVEGRDGEPLTFRWKVRTNPMAAPYPISFEQTGVDGVRLVGLSGGVIIECDDDEEYEEMLKGKYRPAAEERYAPGVTAAPETTAAE